MDTSKQNRRCRDLLSFLDREVLIDTRIILQVSRIQTNLNSTHIKFGQILKKWFSRSTSPPNLYWSHHLILISLKKLVEPPKKIQFLFKFKSLKVQVYKQSHERPNQPNGWFNHWWHGRFFVSLAPKKKYRMVFDIKWEIQAKMWFFQRIKANQPFLTQEKSHPFCPKGYFMVWD